MGEIATWSAVKSKVGLGKDGNDCPTKAELLALSPTGTGGNYVGLELSNASSYGNNECVKLEDIHKVTYKYTFTSRYSSISFDALGNPSSSNQGFGFISTKQKYWDGVANGAEVTVNYIISNTPTWVTNHGNQVPPWTASENLGLTSRSDSNTLVTQNESGKTFKVTFTQAAASQSWSYGFSVNPTSMSFGATGGTKTFTVTSYKQELRNGHNYGNQIALTYTRANSGSVSGSGTSVTMGNNTSTSTRSGTVTLTQAETGKKLTLSCSQSAGYRTYSEITLSGGAVSDIPASGGTRSSFTTVPSYSQTWGWNGSTTGGGTVTTGASISYGTAVSASSLGTTSKARTRVGSLTCTVSLNGKSKSITLDVYQAANSITSTTDGTPVISLSANSYSISNLGGSVNIYASVSIPTTNHWSSGSTSAGSSKSDTPTVSASGTGFSLNSAKTVLTATENTGTSSRSCTVTASYSGATTKTIKVTQNAVSVSWSYGFSVNPTSMSFGATGGTKTFTVTSYKQELRNGHNYGNQIALTYTRANSGSVSGSGTSVTMGNNTSTSTRSGTVTLTQAETGKKLTLSCSQSAGYRTYSEITLSGGAVSDIPASGGTRSSFTTVPSYSQTWGWNGSTTGGGTVTTGASISYGTAVSASSLGTTSKARTRVGSLTCTVSLNGKSKSITLDVYQAANSITSTTDGTPVISLSANSYSISNLGGSVNIYASVSIPTTNHWSSGSTSAGSSKSDTPTVSASGTGFSLNSAKTVLTATENTGTSSRSCTVTASYSGATTKTITVTQSAASVSYEYYLAFTSPTGSRTTSRTGLSALGGNNFTVDVAYSFKTKVINGSEISTRYPLALTVTSKPSWVTNVAITTLSSDNGNYGLTLTLTENTVESTRSGTIKLRQAENDYDGWELTVNITQNAAVITYEYYFSV